MAMKTLEDLFVNQLKSLYGMERQHKKVLPKLVKSADSSKLRAAFEAHVKESDVHVNRLEQVFQSIEVKPKAKECHRHEGLMNDCVEAVEEKGQPSVHDAALIAATQYVEHDEIAGYGCARTWAQLLHHDKAANLLQQTLEEEKAFDKRLTEIAMDINSLAMGPVAV